MKKRIVLAFILILSLSIIILIYCITISYGLTGTYSSDNEPDKENIWIVLKNENFTIYNQEKILENGLFEEIKLNNKSNVYKLVSGDNTGVGYIVYDKNRIILLDFNGMDFSMKKISTSAIYLNYESE